MQKRSVQRGRPAGTTNYEAEPAAAFGAAVRAARLRKGVAQDEFAGVAGVERSHLGKIERGEHMPTLAMILRISVALEISSADLMAATEEILRSGSTT
ncbi:helix-turn-helix transcriptional regulator [Pseudomonas amygdali]|uniref:helix-turn-helix domain-containing protein n=1 Tax=Pseudomonas amygdali TaxID=47877 RepID=UPI001CD8E2EC|nr:helix-turn-helix transcriptional regulator [Pseudomonas amygdali]UBT80460.1 helix-turn-helix transcriptional regulator [Pseudomonas amygdali]